MRIIRKRQLIIERERCVTIRFKAAPIERFCTGCNERGRFITLEEASVIKERSAFSILRMIEDGTLHSAATVSGLPLICFASLAKTNN